MKTTADGYSVWENNNKSATTAQRQQSGRERQPKYER